ncbi:MAG: tRNA pseudouridine(38-40) synthase TruA [Rhodobacteraceae bacterium]|nr:tRNA pseudouridine(38-40) synthase TruA [Paracoccaceae bacterium]
MPRYALLLEYLGSAFAGWQRQSGQTTVQGSIEAALARLDPPPHSIAAAGRTDSGVHALAQVAHCDLQREWALPRLKAALNDHLRPAPVAVLCAARVSDHWHARFCAQERRYLYRILVRQAPAPLWAGRLWHITHPLDIEAMRCAARHLIGTHDFTTFRAAACQARSPIKTMDDIRIEQKQMEGAYSGHEVRFHFRARSFLQHQVRSMVGTLERVGAARWRPDDVKVALHARNRRACGPVCPAHGLYLAGVRYATAPFAQTQEAMPRLSLTS